MRLGYFADGPWSHLALEKIVCDDRFEIAFIVPRFDSQDPVLRDWAKKLGVEFIPIENVNRPEAVEKLRGYKADLFVSMSFNQILRKEILAVPSKGFINCHAGALPFYRGRNILNWVLINDEKEFGVTVHYVDEGIDTGNIILQRMYPITDQDDYATLLERATRACAELLYEAMIQIENDSVKQVVQATIDSRGSYFGRRVAGDEWIDWGWTSRRIFNFVRAITTPGPCARTMLGEDEIAIERVSLLDNASDYLGTAGEIVGKEDGCLTVKTGDSTIRVELFARVDSGAQKRGADDNLFSQLRIGNRFGVNIHSELLRLRKRVDALEQSK